MTPEQFRSIRKKLDVSQEKLAQAIGVTATTVAHIEQNLRPISGPIVRLMLVYERNPKMIKLQPEGET